MKVKHEDFTNAFDNLFLIAKEMIEDHGEDNFYCAQYGQSALLGVFDGCGGLGARTYTSFQGHTGAYMASRIVSGAVHDWYHTHYRYSWPTVQQFADSLLNYIQKGYKVCTSYADNNLRIRGSMVRDFPTTAAIAFTQPAAEGIQLFVVWAGDSRIYLMDRRGLAQLSKDDIESGDALSNLSDDGALTNLLSSDGRYTLHMKSLHIMEPSVIFVATDGCFGYIPTPMEFEYLILNNLLSADGPESFQDKLGREIEAFAGDDYALGMMSLYFGSFQNMQHFFSDRVRFLEHQYILPLQKDRNSEHINLLWQEYRTAYERYL